MYDNVSPLEHSDITHFPFPYAVKHYQSKGGLRLFDIPYKLHNPPWSWQRIQLDIVKNPLFVER